MQSSRLLVGLKSFQCAEVDDRVLGDVGTSEGTVGWNLMEYRSVDGDVRWDVMVDCRLRGCNASSSDLTSGMDDGSLGDGGAITSGGGEVSTVLCRSGFWRGLRVDACSVCGAEGEVGILVLRCCSTAAVKFELKSFRAKGTKSSMAGRSLAVCLLM